ncbi:MAG: NmrA family transcriptional regulator [Acidobacteria bacterium]|nr:MAG: NmrA family transcriptional regulator [Acidobacteriota bacterium]REJ98081.1 MAG: NmrA family transcriptional regulator [Acidobacteriota bacterium]REK16824.1 MAG: NmrA family transcriptional regulator [Acidobacteriota bacterium]REK42735.1 MAG: NmrA family transcriptional regulator [Acidobacteriota bacterium]
MKNENKKKEANNRGLTLVIGGTGKTGRRIVAGLKEKGVPVRIGSRSASPSFDWGNEAGWDACLEGVESVYISFAPDLAIPGATDSIRTLVDKAKKKGVKKLVLLSGRGEEEAQASERIVQESGLEWTIVRASWFNQNFSEGAFIEMVLSGQITLPAGSTKEPFVDVHDIADVALAALTEDGHGGEVYEVTGPRLMSFADVASDLSDVTNRPIEYVEIPHEAFVGHIRESGAPKDVVWIMDYLFSTVLDGRNSYVTDGVQRALGRKPKDFSDYARDIAKAGVWETA